ncbi:hypothetical protein ACLB2K_042138 [Fragaria x ananassa]
MRSELLLPLPAVLFTKAGRRREERHEMRKLLLVCLTCANPDSSKRPTMRRVLQILSSEAVPVVKPSFIFSCGVSLSLDDIVSDCDEGSILQLKPRPHGVSILVFGAVGDGKTLNTLAFQNVIFYLKSFADKGVHSFMCCLEDGLPEVSTLQAISRYFWRWMLTFLDLSVFENPKCGQLSYKVLGMNQGIRLGDCKIHLVFI